MLRCTLCIGTSAWNYWQVPIWPGKWLTVIKGDWKILFFAKSHWRWLCWLVCGFVPSVWYFYRRWDREQYKFIYEYGELPKRSPGAFRTNKNLNSTAHDIVFPGREQVLGYRKESSQYITAIYVATRNHGAFHEVISTSCTWMTRTSLLFHCSGHRLMDTWTWWNDQCSDIFGASECSHSLFFSILLPRDCCIILMQTR